MSNRVVDRPLLLALAALHEVAGWGRDGPVQPSVWLRALLAMVHARSNGDRMPYEAYWQRITWPGDGEAGDGYMRATYARTEWTRIVRTLGIAAESMALDGAVEEVIAQQRAAVDPAYRAVLATTQALLDAKYDREIISRKGCPFSERGRALMAERLARGEEPA